jgi:hypothetical protein
VAKLARLSQSTFLQFHTSLDEISPRQKSTSVALHAAQICKMANQGNVVVGQGNMPQANNYLTLLGQARASAVINEYILQGKTTVDPQWGCILVSSGIRPDGYAHTKRWTNVDLLARAAGQVLPRNSQTNFLLHRVAFLARHGRDVNGVSSHLCPHRNCLLHVIDETQAVNVSRSKCQGQVRCPQHQTVLYDFCQHNPQCLRTPLMGSCCLDDGPSTDESVHDEERIIPDSQESEVALSDFQSMLGDPHLMPGSQYLALGSQEEEESVNGSESEQGEVETPLENLSLLADEEIGAPSSSPPRLLTRRRGPRLPVQESSSSQPSSQQDPASSQLDSFVVGDDVVMYDSSVGPSDDADF